MFNFSVKQLLRQPGKALLFFLLMAASTALVVTGAVLTIENSERLRIVEETYSTIGYIEQIPVDTESIPVPNPCFGSDRKTTIDYGGYIHPEDLDFPGADYIVKPEKRPYYVFTDPELSGYALDHYFHVVEFTPLQPVGEDGVPVEVEITKILFSTDSPDVNSAVTIPDAALHEGDHITVCQCFGPTRYPMKVGEKYVAELYLYMECPEHRVNEYVIYSRPHSGRTDREGNYIGTENFPDDIDWGYSSPSYSQIAHVTGEDFYEKGNVGYNYIKWAAHYELRNHSFCAIATNSLELIPCWHEDKLKVPLGREITPEEFESGAPVCMVSKEFAARNKLEVGDKVKMPFICASHRDQSTVGGELSVNFSLMDENGEFYEPFFEQEYEIVGLTTGNQNLDTEWGQDNFVIPAKSVTVSDEDRITYYQPMTRRTASFQIPNGSIQEFDAALKEHVPDAERLSITYDDRGYSEIMKSLRNARDMANLLLLGGVLAALTIIALLLYFFVVKEKKRTAVERSLGMTKAQCRVSLLSALMILTVLSASAGSVCGILALDKVSEPETVAKTAVERDSMYDYDTRYSPWAAGRELAEKAEIEVEPPLYVSYAVPLALSLLVLALGLLLMTVSFGTDPIYLLNTREKE